MTEYIEKTNKTIKLEKIYWAIIIAVLLLALLLMVTYFLGNVAGPTEEPDSEISSAEQRLLRLENLRNTSTVVPASREERLNRLNQLSSGQ